MTFRSGSEPEQSFREQLLRYRGRTRLTQRQLAERMAVHPRSIQDWESGVNHPSPERLRSLIAALLAAGALSAGHETQDAEALWASAERESTRMHAGFDEPWFASLLAQGAPPGDTATELATPSPGTLPGPERRQDWGDAPDTADFVGRSADLAVLQGWVVDEHCRLLAVLGMGGIGKTRLAAKMAQAVAPSFECVYWRSLRDAPSAREWLAGAIGFLSDQRLLPPPAESERVAALLRLLRDRRCLLMLDNAETLFEPAQREPRYRAGLGGYGQVFEAVGNAWHASCLLLTSRESPPEVAVLGGTGAVRTFHVSGFPLDDAQLLLASKQLQGTAENWAELNARFGGNGLALQVVGESVRQVFGGDIGDFLEQTRDAALFGGIRRLLAEQVDRSSEVEQQVLRLLAVEREPVRLTNLVAALDPGVRRGQVLEAVEALRRRSMVERVEVAGLPAFTLQSVMLEYMTDQLIESVALEIEVGRPSVLTEVPLIKAHSNEYVRRSQERLIGEPILRRVNAHGDSAATEQRLMTLMDGWRGVSHLEQGYGPGNAVNLLRLLKHHLRGIDLSDLTIRQAYLAGIEAQGASLAGANVAESVLAEAFDFPGSVALSANGERLAAGTSTGQVWVWRVADRTLLAVLDGHSGAVWGVAFSEDGELVASSGAEGDVRLWEAGAGRQLAILSGHEGAVWAAALSADGRLLASGGADATVRLWDTAARIPLGILRGHTGGVRSVSMSADGHLIASGGQDQTVRLWDSSTGQAVAELHGHTGALWGVALSADGQLLASGGQDGTVRVWEVDSGQPLTTLQGHTGGVWSTAVSADARRIASGGGDGTLRVWGLTAARSGSGPSAILQGHSGSVWGAALSADGSLLASGGGDGTVRLWDAAAGRALATLQGHTRGVRAVALAAEGQVAASGGQDGAVRLWQCATGQLFATLPGHTGGLWGLALSEDGRLVASAGGDHMVRLWEAGTGRLLATFEGHSAGIWSLALSRDGRLLASGDEHGNLHVWQTDSRRAVAKVQADTSAVAGLVLSNDGVLLVSGGAAGTVRVWQTNSLGPAEELVGHASAVWGLALDATGRLLVTGSEDETVRIWDLGSHQCVLILRGHTNAVYGVAMSASGGLVVSGGADGSVRLWDASSGRQRALMRGHVGVVRSVALSSDGLTIASGGFDGTVRLWDVRSTECVRVLRSSRRYEHVDVSGLTGITSAQRQALLALGAVDRSGVPA